MRKKAVFFDIDGTLWDIHNVIPESTVRAIRALRKNGHLAILCSGRARAYIQSPELLAIGFDGLVAGCGTYAELNDTVLYEHLIEKELALHTVETVRSYGFRPVLEGPDYLYMDDEEFAEEPYGQKLMRELGAHRRTIKEDYGNWKINKLSCATDHADRDACFAALSEHYTYLIHNSAVAEFVPKGHTKATGIQRMCEALGIAQEDTAAFGDSVNDLDMLSYVGCGVAMGNATAQVKEAADYVTADLMDDGIFRGLAHLGLIEAEETGKW